MFGALFIDALGLERPSVGLSSEIGECGIISEVAAENVVELLVITVQHDFCPLGIPSYGRWTRVVLQQSMKSDWKGKMEKEDISGTYGIKSFAAGT